MNKIIIMVVVVLVATVQADQAKLSRSHRYCCWFSVMFAPGQTLETNVWPNFSAGRQWYQTGEMN